MTAPEPPPQPLPPAPVFDREPDANQLGRGIRSRPRSSVDEGCDCGERGVVGRDWSGAARPRALATVRDAGRLACVGSGGSVFGRSPRSVGGTSCGGRGCRASAGVGSVADTEPSASGAMARGGGTLWSRRMVPDRVRVPDFEDGAALPIRVQCRDASGGGLNPDDNIRFATAVILEVAETVRYAVHHGRSGTHCVSGSETWGRAGSSSPEGIAVAHSEPLWADIPEASQFEPESMPCRPFVLDAVRLVNVEQAFADHGDHEILCRQECAASDRHAAPASVARRSSIASMCRRWIGHGDGRALARPKASRRRQQSEESNLRAACDTFFG